MNRSPQGPETLAHAHEPQPFLALQIGVGDLKPVALIFDCEVDAVGRPRQGHARCLRSAMLRDIREALLGYTKEPQRHL